MVCVTHRAEGSVSPAGQVSFHVRPREASRPPGRPPPAARAAGETEPPLLNRARLVSRPLQGPSGTVLLCHADNVTHGR